MLQAVLVGAQLAPVVGNIRHRLVQAQDQVLGDCRGQRTRRAQRAGDRIQVGVTAAIADRTRLRVGDGDRHRLVGVGADLQARRATIRARDDRLGRQVGRDVGARTVDRVDTRQGDLHAQVTEIQHLVRITRRGAHVGDGHRLGGCAVRQLQHASAEVSHSERLALGSSRDVDLADHDAGGGSQGARCQRTCTCVLGR